MRFTVLALALFPGVNAVFGCSLTNGAQNPCPWTSLGPFYNYVNSIAISPADSQILLAGAEIGMFRSTDGGATWNAASVGLADVCVGEIAFSKSQPDIVYTCADSNTSLGQSCYRSQDGGQTWTRLPVATQMLVVDPRDSQVLYALGMSGPDVSATEVLFQSVDGGAHWRQVPNIPPQMTFFSIAIAPSQPDVVYVGTSMGVGKTTDRGGTWNLASQQPIGPLAVDPFNALHVYGISLGALLESVDGGTTWNKIASGMGDSPVAIVIDPSRAENMYIVSDFLLISRDAGRTWSDPSIATDILGAAVDPNDSMTVYAGTDGHGLERSTDGGSTWATILSPAGGVLDLYADAKQPGTWLAGTDNFLYRSINGGQTWNQLDVGGSMGNLSSFSSFAPSLQNPDLVYAGTYLGLMLSPDAGQTWSYVDTLGSAMINGVTMDVGNASRIYTKGRTCSPCPPGVWPPGRISRSEDGGNTWIAADNGLPVVLTMAAMVADATESGWLYLATDKGLYISQDAGDNWSLVTSLPPSEPVGAVLTDARQPGVIYAGCNDYFTTAANYVQTLNPGRVVVSQDGGQTWNALGPLPTTDNELVTALALDPADPTILYVATHIHFPSYDRAAVWRTANGGNTWQNVSPTTMPQSAKISRILFDPSQPSRLYAATGEGVWIIDVPH